MKKGKKLLSLALSLATALSLLPATALAAEDEPDLGVLTYTEVIKPQYEAAEEFSEDLAAVKKDGKWGFIDHDGKTVIPFQYDYAWSFSEGYAIVAKAVPGAQAPEDDYYEYTGYLKAEIGFIDKNNNYTAFVDPVASSGYDDNWNYNYYAGPLVREFYRYSDTWDWEDEDGVVHSEYEEYGVLPEEEYNIFHNGVVVMSSGEYGDSDVIYHTDGKGYAILDEGGDAGYIWATGPMNEGLIPVQTGYKYYYAGYVDAYGKMVKQFSKEDFGAPVVDEWGWEDQSFHHTYYVSSFNQGLALAARATYTAGGDDWDSVPSGLGFIDRDYNWVIQPQYTRYWRSGLYTTERFFGETGLAVMANNDGKYGAIDKSGKTVIPFQYDDLLPIDEGRTAFATGGKWGYLDAATLEVLIPAQYDQATSFNNGLAVVQSGDTVYVIDWNGDPVPGADKLDKDNYFWEKEDGSRRYSAPTEYVVIKEDGKYGYGHIDYLPPLPDESEMSGWAYADVTAAIKAELIPVSLQNLYLNNIKRGEFCSTVIQAITETLDTDVETLVKDKTGKTLDSYQKQYPFSDTTSSDVIAAYALGIVAGRGNGTFDPYATITRQEAAAFLTRGANVLGMNTAIEGGSDFNDDATIDVWAKDSVDFVYQIKVMSGTGNDNFSPLGTYTREQSYSTIYRLYKAALGLE